jgi:hypothetical protein
MDTYQIVAEISARILRGETLQIYGVEAKQGSLTAEGESAFATVAQLSAFDIAQGFVTMVGPGAARRALSGSN